MGEPSAEALGMARELYGNDEAALAAALQRFMDVVEKTEALADKQHQELKRIVEPWERAKRQYEAGAAVVLGFKERAEKAEARARIWKASAKHHRRYGYAADAAEEAATARLAELVLKLEGWRQTFGREHINVITGKDVRAALSVLIAEYEGGESGGLCEHEQARKNCPACIYKRDKAEGGEHG